MRLGLIIPHKTKVAIALWCRNTKKSEAPCASRIGGFFLFRIIFLMILTILYSYLETILGRVWRWLLSLWTEWWLWHIKDWCSCHVCFVLYLRCRFARLLYQRAMRSFLDKCFFPYLIILYKTPANIRIFSEKHGISVENRRIWVEFSGKIEEFILRSTTKQPVFSVVFGRFCGRFRSFLEKNREN